MRSSAAGTAMEQFFILPRTICFEGIIMLKLLMIFNYQKKICFQNLKYSGYLLKEDEDIFMLN